MKKTTFVLFLSLISIQNLFFIKNIVSGEENTKQAISITTTEEQNNPIKETEALESLKETQISKKKENLISASDTGNKNDINNKHKEQDHEEAKIKKASKEDNNDKTETPKLKITEVFLKEAEEFIEIKNIGDIAFDWKLTLQRTKTIKQIFDANIPANTYLILTKNNIIKSENVLPLELEFTKREFKLSLIFDSETLDSVTINKTQIETSKAAEASLEKLEKKSQQLIQTTEKRMIENPNWYLINPGKAFEEVGLNNNTWNWNGKLILSEIFFHKDNSRFEITNTSNREFNGNISIEGINKKKFEYKINIPQKSSLVMAENNRYLNQNIVFKITNDKYNFAWKENFEAKLFYDKNQVDTLFVHKERVKKIKDSNSSFQKVLNNGIWITTKTNMDQKENIKWNFWANPWTYLRDQENTKDISKAIEKKDDDSNTDPIPEECWDIDNNMIEIQEIFWGNQFYWPFIEIKILDNPKKYEQFKISWWMLEEEIILDKKEDNELWNNGRTFLISNTNHRDESLVDHIVVDNLKFKNQYWKLKFEWLNWQKRQLLDIIELIAFPSEKSLYFDWNKKHCQRIFDSSGDFSPWFERKFLKFFQINSTPKVEYVYVNKGWWGSCSCPTKEDLCPIKEQKNGENKKQEKSEWKEEKTPIKEKESPEENKSYEVKIEDIIYNPPGSDKDKESITLLLTKGKELNLKNTHLLVNGKKKKLSGILEEGISQTFIRNFWFPNTSKDAALIKIELKIWDQILDTFYYNIQTPEKKEEKNNKEGLKVYSVLDGDTLRYRDENWKLQSVRLLGVDSPESNTARYKKTECFGKEAKDYLTQRVKWKNIKIEYDSQSAGKDRYGRSLAYIYVDNKLINAELITQWYAKEYTFKTSYDKQTHFKELEKKAKKDKVWLRNPLYCPDNQKTEETAHKRSDLIIKITDINYNPKGGDKGKESIKITSYDKSGQIDHIDFNQHFSLFIFEKTGSQNIFSFDDFEYGKGKFLDLGFLGKKERTSEIVLKGAFNLPNTKSSCIALIQKEHIFDIACYDITEKEKIEDTIFSGTIKILSVVPNPRGKDAGKEEIELLYEGEKKKIDLSQNYFLLINGKTKKKLSGILKSEITQKIEWNFSLPNTNACIEIQHEKTTLDKFCYTQEKEWSRISNSKIILEEINTQELKVLKQISLKKIGSEICLVYQKEKIQCRKLPKTKIDPKLKQEAKLYKSALKTFENEMRKKYSPLFYQTEFVELFKLLNQAKRNLKDWKYNHEIGDKTYNWAEFWKIYEEKKKRSLISKSLESMISLFPKELKEIYKEKEQQREATLKN